MKLKKDDLILLYRNMVLGRLLDQMMIVGLATGKVMSFFHSGQGSDALAAGVATFLRKDDFLMPHHRGHAITYIISKGSSAVELLAEHYGLSGGSCKGITGLHGVDPDYGLLGATGVIGSVFPLTLGYGLAAKKNNTGQVAVGCFGDGGSNRGTLHEAFNLASLWKLPIIWVCDNNGISQFMPASDAFPREDIADLAIPYDMPGVVVDGMDVLAVSEAMIAAVERARAGEGPSLIEGKTARFRAHGEGVPDVIHAEPRSQEMIDELMKRDPINMFAEQLVGQNVMTREEIEKMNAELQEEANEIDRKAMEGEKPDPSILENMLYAD